jgi:NAD-dependent dihydropyrimidine dehydrogenase PreA subunit/nitroreductase
VIFLSKAENEPKEINNSIISIDLEGCTKCKACITACPARLFYFEADKLQILDIFEDTCIECGHCVAICPVNVIRLKIHEHKPLKSIELKKERPSYESFYNLALTRRSIRQFKDESIDRSLIEKLLDIVEYSPTAENAENVCVSIIQDKELVAKISDAITTQMRNFIQLAESPQGLKALEKMLSKNAYKTAMDNLPQLKEILKMIDHGLDFWCWNGELIILHGDKETGFIRENCSLAAAHIMLAAELLGLATCSLGFLMYLSEQFKQIKKLMNIPKKNLIGYAHAIGYPDVKYKRIPARKPLKVEWI